MGRERNLKLITLIYDKTRKTGQRLLVRKKFNKCILPIIFKKDYWGTGYLTIPGSRMIYVEHDGVL